MAHLPFIAAAGLGLAWVFSGTVHHIPDNQVTPLADYRDKPEIPEQLPKSQTGTPAPGEHVVKSAWYLRKDLDAQLVRFGSASTYWNSCQTPDWCSAVELIAGHYQRHGYDVTRERHYEIRHAPDGDDSLTWDEFLCVKPNQIAIHSYIFATRPVKNIPAIGEKADSIVV